MRMKRYMETMDYNELKQIIFKEWHATTAKIEKEVGKTAKSHILR